MKCFSIYFMVLIATMCFSCGSSDEPVSTADNFFPLGKGIYQIYDVEEIIYTLGEPDTAYYQLKTVVVDSFPNTESGYTYVIHRSKRDEGEQDWTYFDTWSAVLNNQKLIVSEGNVAFVKLAFPAKAGATWNGNEYNNIINQSTSQHDDAYSIIERNVNSSFPEGEFVTVQQEDNQEFIVYFDKRIERYTQNIGLVYKETTQLNYCTQNDCLGQQKVESGLIYRQTIAEHGKE